MIPWQRRCTGLRWLATTALAAVAAYWGAMAAVDRLGDRLFGRPHLP